MTWIGGRRTGWIPGRHSNPRPPANVPPVPSKLGEPSPPQPIAVPPYQTFSPASIAAVLRVNRSTVHYWLQAGKLDSYRDNIGEPYITRAELLRFIRDYLRRAVTECAP